MSQVSLGKVKGDNGADGKSPYQVAVEEGYNGTEAEFYAALVSLQNAPFLPTSGGTMSGPLNMGGQKITMIPDPESSTDAATMGYVDGLVGSINSTLDAINGEVV